MRCELNGERSHERLVGVSFRARNYPTGAVLLNASVARGGNSAARHASLQPGPEARGSRDHIRNIGNAHGGFGLIGPLRRNEILLLRLGHEGRLLSLTLVEDRGPAGEA